MSPGAVFGAAAGAPREHGAAPASRRPGIRVVPGGAGRAPRAPFVVLVLVVLGVGLVGLLLLNTALQRGAFELRDLERETRQLRAEETALSRQVLEQSVPATLERRADRLGMVPADERRFIDLDGPAAGGVDDAGAAEAGVAGEAAGGDGE